MNNKTWLGLIVLVGLLCSCSDESGDDVIGNSYGYLFEVDGVHYSTTGGLTCSVVAGDKEYSDDMTIPSQVSFSDRIFNVTSIADSAFYDCDSLKSITLSPGLTSIGDRAFMYCDQLTSVTLPEGLTNIGVRAFFRCKRLASITLPRGLTFPMDWQV